MTARARAAKGKRDSNHRAIADAIRALGCPVMDLSAAGGGVEDLLVAVRRRDYVDDQVICLWLFVECKVGRVRYTARQQTWRAQTALWPRLTVTSAQQAVDEIRRLTG